MQLDTSQNIIAMMMSIIGENFESLQTLSLLARTSKLVHTSVYGDESLVRNITKMMPLMPRKAVRKLFVLTESTFVPFAAVQEKPIYPWSRVILRCSAFDAFKVAMEVHKNIPSMVRAFERRKVRSNTMKRVCAMKAERKLQIYRERRADVVEIRSDLVMIPQRDHFPTHSEMHYVIHGIVRGLNGVYRDKKLMMIHMKPNPSESDIACVELYKREMRDPDSLSHKEKMAILSCNIAFEHFLSNYTSHREMYISVVHLGGAAHPIDFLYPLPDNWPWVANTPIRNICEFQYDEVPAMYRQWRAAHDTLYEDEPIRQLN
ncbi:hypothetical protein T484DRAFT_1747630 [Baffinella frigidus]|nr:hypothetical protein T484DRAFT_1747630 [Cryptophyta sp. CCMP2293]